MGKKMEKKENDRKPDVDDDLWLVDDVASFLRCTRKFVYSMVAKRKIPHYKLSNRLRFSRSMMVSWLQTLGVPIVEVMGHGEED